MTKTPKPLATVDISKRLLAGDEFDHLGDGGSAFRWLEAELDKSILDLLRDPSPPSKPIDPNAPLPHWAKRTLQKAWIKQERERLRAV